MCAVRLTVSFLIGASVGIGVYVLSLTGVWPDGDQYALILGLWAMVTEVIPYVGPDPGCAAGDRPGCDPFARRRRSGSASSTSASTSSRAT